MKPLFRRFKRLKNTSMGIKVKRVEPDMVVNLSDIAKRTNLSRQQVSMLVTGKRGDGTFPPPISKIISPNPLWKWSTVAEWMLLHKKLDKKAVQDAYIIEDMNGALELRDQDTAIRRQELLQRIESKNVA